MLTTDDLLRFHRNVAAVPILVAADGTGNFMLFRAVGSSFCIEIDFDGWCQTLVAELFVIGIGKTVGIFKQKHTLVVSQIFEHLVQFGAVAQNSYLKGVFNHMRSRVADRSVLTRSAVYFAGKLYEAIAGAKSMVCGNLLAVTERRRSTNDRQCIDKKCIERSEQQSCLVASILVPDVSFAVLFILVCHNNLDLPPALKGAMKRHLSEGGYLKNFNFFSLFSL